MWDPELPAVPADFPANQSCALNASEATYLRDRIVFSHPSSFLATVVRAKRKQALKVDYPWLYPDVANLSKAHVELLDNGRLFSEVIFGAAIGYNLSLAKAAARDQLAEELQQTMVAWAAERDWEGIAKWDLQRFWALVVGQGHQITPAARAFVEEWLRLALGNANRPEQLFDVAGPLVQRRESQLKGARSRFVNQAARDQWRGAAGLYRLDYRWGTVVQLLQDLYRGLEER
jgi:hypothetical protein